MKTSKNFKQTKGIHKIPIPTPFAVGPVNVYLIEGDNPSLIDTGPGTQKASKALREGIGRLGYKIADIKKIVLTHGHIDHFGLASQIKADSGAKVYIHINDRSMVDKFETSYERRVSFGRTLFQKAGFPESIIEKVIEINRAYKGYGQQVPVDCTLEDGHELTLGRFKLTVVHCPGHTCGMVCLYDKARKLLFSGDHILKHITPNPLIEASPGDGTKKFKALSHFIDSLKRIEKLDIDVVLPGHGDNIYEHRGLIGKILRHHESRKQRILAILRNGTRACQICEELFPDLPIEEVYLGFSEVIGHLEVLELEGRVRSHEQDGLIYYHRAQLTKQ